MDSATGIIGFIFALLAAAVPGKAAIRLLKRLNAKQNVSEDAPAAHQAKQGTPTMGGLLILFSLTLTTLGYFAATQISAHRHAADDFVLLPVLLVTLGFGAIGFTDDLLSAKRGKNLGLRAREKFTAQILVAVTFVVWMYMTARPGLTTYVELIPTSISSIFDSHSGSMPGPVVLDFGLLYYLLAVPFMVGLSNATNFTDGLDGLSSGISILISLTLGALTWAMRPDLGFFCVAFAGALSGFLWWNAHPAKVFMGDTCALAIGAGLAAVALLSKNEVGLIVASLVCWAELISVMIQVIVFKYRKKRHGLAYAQANRVFRRAPLHHHFEELGWSETSVVVRFWLLGAIASGAALLWMRN